MEQLSAFRMHPANTAAATVDRYHRFSPNRWYVQNNHDHGVNVSYLAGYLAQRARDELGITSNIQRLAPLCLVHDHHEYYPPLGDIQAVYKRFMNEAELAEVERLEVEAINWMIGLMPELYDRWNYGSLLWEAHYKETFIAQLMKWADMIDGYCLSLHEILAGNQGFLVIHKHTLANGIEILLPNACTDYEEFYFPKVLRKLTQAPTAKLGQLFAELRSPILLPPAIHSHDDYVAWANHGQPHTRASIDRMILSQEFPLYAAWLKVLRDAEDPAIMQWLTTVNPR